MQLLRENMGIRRAAHVTALVVVAWALLSVAFIGAASAQTDPYGNGGPDVEAEVIGTDEGTGNNEVGSDSSTLPFTGADLTLFVVIGACAIGAGAFLVRRTRQRADSA